MSNISACFRVTPIIDRGAAEMVRSIKVDRLLEGYRGHPPADISAMNTCLKKCLKSLSWI